MKKKFFSSKVLIRALAFFIVVFLIYRFVDLDISRVMDEIQTKSWASIFAIAILGLVPSLVEASNYYILSRSYTRTLSWLDAFKSSLMAAFYRLISLGFGGGVSTIYYLGDYSDMKLSMTSSISIFYYISLKVSISLAALVAYLLNFRRIGMDFGPLNSYILLALAFNLIIISLLFMVMVSRTFHRVILALASLLLRNEEVLGKIQAQLDQLHQAWRDFSKDKSCLFKILGLNFLRLLALYSIPKVLLMGQGPSYGYFLSLMAIIMAISALIPSPSGIGSLELVFLGIFEPMVGLIDAASAIFLFRFASFILPGLIGGLVVLVSRVLLGNSPSSSHMLE